MVQKRILRSEKVREVPRQFSWIDQRLLSEGYFKQCSVAAWGLYLFLVVVGDAQGLSYYSDASICHLLSLSTEALAGLRQELEGSGVLCYRKPLYQVLSLSAEGDSPRQRQEQAIAVGEVLRRVAQAVRR